MDFTELNDTVVPPQAKSFYEENAEAIKLFVFMGLFFYIEKRMVKRVVAKELSRLTMKVVLGESGFADRLVYDND